MAGRGLKMGKRKLPKVIKPKDDRKDHNPYQSEQKEIHRTNKSKKIKLDLAATRVIEKPASSMFFTHNESLGPPYHVLVDTNFINMSIQNKIDIVKGMMNCLLAKCIPYISDCVIAELEKLGSKFRIALRMAKDPRFQRLSCSHPGTYADDCIVRRVEMHKCYIVATNDKDLKMRLRKIPGVPIMYVKNHQYTVERLPEAWGAPRN